MVDSGNEVAISWWERTMPGAAVREEGVVRVPLTTLVARSSGDNICESLFRQLVWQCARRIEAAVFRSRKAPPDHPQALVAKTMDLLQLLDHPNQLDHELLRYVTSGVEALQGHTHLSYICDKGNVAGAHLMPGMFATSDNVGVVACPQVIRCSEQTHIQRTLLVFENCLKAVCLVYCCFVVLQWWIRMFLVF